ncbi:MAG: class I SAM-dependent methyltransferase [Elusimicrobia bacterium]|nr:class I SAM-dependent methyltransferase [Candidatus Obscuribacterium magneticum]
MENQESQTLRQRTIDDFGEQWTHFPDNEGFYGSSAILRDAIGPLFSLSDVAGGRVAEIGSGTGRIVKSLLEAGAGHVWAIEPSEAVPALEKNLAGDRERVTILPIPGEELPLGLNLDYIFSIGVIHHVPDPRPILKRAHQSLKPKGKLVIWVYGRENNLPYIFLVSALRLITTRMPHTFRVFLSKILNFGLDIYMFLCRFFPLPLKGYVMHVLRNFDRKKRELVIYDQLNPAYAKFYRKDEIEKLLREVGFDKIALHHRHGYSWTILGEK